MSTLFSSACSAKIRPYLCAASFCAAVGLTLLSVTANAQNALSADELLLDPTNLPTFERQINLIWKPVRDKIATLEDPGLAGRPQAALVNIYVENNSWQLAWEYAQNIRVPVWRAQALLLIAKHQRENGIKSLSDRMLNSAIFLLKPVGDADDAPEVFANTALAIIANEDFELLEEFFTNVSGEQNILAMSRAAYPVLPAEHRPIVLERIQKLSRVFEQELTQNSFRFFLGLVNLGKTLEIDEMHRQAISSAYNVSLRRRRDDNLRDAQLEQLADNLIFTGQHRLALQVIAQIRTRTIQSRLYATAGRVRIELFKNSEAGRPLLNLANDSLLLIDAENDANQTQPRDAEALKADIDHARTWNMIEKTQAGLEDESLRDAERIEDEYQKQRAIALIALVLADQEKYDKIRKLTDKLNFANLRLSLHLGLVASLSDPDDVSELLLQGLESENFHESRSGYSPRGLAAVLTVQLEHGNAERNDAVFDAVLRQVRTHLMDFEQILGEIEYLYHYAKRSRLKADEADAQMKVILSSLWPHTEHPDYAYAMSRITQFYIDENRLEQAFNVAASLSNDDAAIKFRILEQIAEIASREGDEALSLRIINQITDLPRQVNLLTQAINNLAKSREIQRF